MVKEIKQRLLLVSAFVLFSIEMFLNMSGIQNVYLPLGFGVVMVVLIVWAVIPSLREVWSEIGSEARKTLFLLSFCALTTIAVLNILAIRKLLLWNPEEMMRSVLLENQKEESSEEIKTKIQGWLLASKFLVKDETRADKDIFNLHITDDLGRAVAIQMSKDNKSAIHLQAVVKTNQIGMDQLKKLSDKELVRFLRKIELELLKFGIQWQSATTHEKEHHIMVKDILPYNRSLSNHEFIKKVFYVRNGILLASEMMRSDN